MEASQPKKRGLSFLGSVFIFLILILGISLVSLFYFNQEKDGNGSQEVKFWLYRHAEQEVGEENTFFIFVRNQEKHDLEEAEVVLKFPRGFVLNSSSPDCDQVLDQGCFWSLGRIEKGELKEIEIKGQLFGQAEQDQVFDGNLNFRLAGFSSEFQKSLSSSVMLKPSISLNWQIPEEASFGQEVKSSISLENISQEMISQAEVILNWPENFVLKKADSLTSDGGGLEETEINGSQRQLKWRVKDLNIQDQKGLEFKGSLNDPSVKELVFSLEAGVFHKDEFFLQIKKEKKIFFEKFDFNAVLEANDSIKTVQISGWGEIVPISLTYQNQTQQSIKDFGLKLKLTGGQYVDFSRLYQTRWHYYQGSDSQNSSSFVSGRIFSSVIPDPLSSLSEKGEKGWTSDLISVFKEIKPGTEGMIVFDLPVKTILEAAKNSYSRAEIKLQIIAQGKLAGKEVIWNIPGNEIDLLIKTDVTLDAAAKYYDDEHVALGSGPLPPQVGKESSFWIFWQIKNTTSPLKDISVKTILPAGVSWTGRTKTTHGLVLYSENDREVSWNVSELNIYQGGPYSLVEAGFEVEVIPDPTQLNQTIPLTGTILLAARDGFAKEPVSCQARFLDTDLKGDFWGQNKGKVMENIE